MENDAEQKPPAVDLPVHCSDATFLDAEKLTDSVIRCSERLREKQIKTEPQSEHANAAEEEVESDTNEEDSEPEVDDPYDRAWNSHGRGAPRWGQLAVGSKMPRKRTSGGSSSAKKIILVAERKSSRLAEKAKNNIDTKCCALDSSRPLRRSLRHSCARTDAVHESSGGASSQETPAERFQKFIEERNLVEGYLQYSTTVSTSRKDFLFEHRMLKEWIVFNP